MGPSKRLNDFLGQPASLRVLFGRFGAELGGEEESRLVVDFFEGGTIYGTIVAPRGCDSSAPCLPWEYMFQPHGAGGLTVAESRGLAWQKLSARLSNHDLWMMV